MFVARVDSSDSQLGLAGIQDRRVLWRDVHSFTHVSFLSLMFWIVMEIGVT